MKWFAGLMMLAMAVQAEAAFELKTAVALAQPEAEAVYGKVSFKGAEPYLGLNGAVAAWGIEYYAADWKEPVAALAIAGNGPAEPAVKVWTGKPAHAHTGLLAAAALAVHDRLGVKVSLPEKYYWLGERALWAAYPEKTAAGQPIYCNLPDKQVATSLAAAGKTVKTVSPILRATSPALKRRAIPDQETMDRRLNEISAVPPGLQIFFAQFPPLKGWAKFCRPSGTAQSAHHNLIRYNEMQPMRGDDEIHSNNGVAVGKPALLPFIDPDDLDDIDEGEVITPSDEGITWLRGQTHRIEWEGFDGDEVKIELYKGLSRKKSKGTDNDGSTNWTVDKKATIGSDYRIKITDEDNPFNFDWSDHSFAIASNTRKVVYPSEDGIRWTRGDTVDIKWEGFSDDRVQIELWLGPLRVWEHATENDGSYSWTVADDLISDDNYKIKISEEDDDDKCDWSDNEFEIRGSNAKVKYPSSSGVKWKRGKKYDVKWSGFSGETVQVELWRGNVLKSWKVTDNDGATSWEVSKSLAKGSDYKIRIFSLSRPTQIDWSDKSFKVE